MPGVARRHHVLRAEHLPGEVGHRLGSSVSPGVPAVGWLVRRPDVAPLQCTWSGSQKPSILLEASASLNFPSSA